MEENELDVAPTENKKVQFLQHVQFSYGLPQTTTTFYINDPNPL